MGLLHLDNRCKEGKPKFDILWEECVQQEDRVANQEALLVEYDHALLLIPEEEKENIISRRKFIRGLILLRSFKRIKREITNKKISPLVNVTIVTRYDTLPEIV